MKYFLLNFFYYLLGLLSFLILIFILKRVIDSPASWNVAEITPSLLSLSVIVAILTLLINLKRSASEEYLKSAIDLLSKAYDVLASMQDEQGRPLNSRINWLSSARMIKSSENISNFITEESHIRIWIENKEYWRIKFAHLIKSSEDDFPEEYYASKPEYFITWRTKQQEPLSEKSLAVLYRFIEWKGGDTLDDEKCFSTQEIDRMIHFGPKGLGSLLKKVKDLLSGDRPFDHSV